MNRLPPPTALPCTDCLTALLTYTVALDSITSPLVIQSFASRHIQWRLAYSIDPAGLSL